MAYLIHSIVKFVPQFLGFRVVQLEKRASIIINREDVMNEDTQYNEDYKKLLWWIIALLIGLIGSSATWFISIGAIQEKVIQLEADNKDKVTRQELLSSIDLINNKFLNINEKLDDIKNALNIR